MKKVLLVILSLFMFMPIVNAEVVRENFKTVVQAEIERHGSDTIHEKYINILKNVNLKKYKENNKLPTVYIFRGSGCSHCLEAITHFAELYKSGVKFNLVSYEVWDNTDNYSFAKNLLNRFNGMEFKASVPVIIIGDKYFEGYASDIDKELLEQINNYKGDVIKELIDDPEKALTSKTTTTTTTKVKIEENTNSSKNNSDKNEKYKKLVCVAAIFVVILGFNCIINHFKK